MAGINSKAKGNTFERKISNLFSDRFAEHLGITKGFRRASDSGSFFGGTNKARTETHDLSKATFGDIITPDTFAYSIECKHYKTPPSFASIMKQDYKQLNDWLSQAEQDATACGKRVLVIMKFNNVEEVAVISHDDPLVNGNASVRYGSYVFVPLSKFLAGDTGLFFQS
jgi:hypothetical protein